MCLLLLELFTFKTCMCDVLLDLVPFLQFKNSEKHPQRSVTFSKVSGFKLAILLKGTLLHGCF